MTFHPFLARRASLMSAMVPEVARGGVGATACPGTLRRPVEPVGPAAEGVFARDKLMSWRRKLIWRRELIWADVALSGATQPHPRADSGTASSSAFLVVILFQMEPVQDAVRDRRDEHAYDAEEGHTGIQRVERREELRGDLVERRHRSHAGQDHRGVQDRIQPGQAGGQAIAGRSQ